jgi:hypothetical protein
MNDPILIIRNTFLTHLHALLFSASFKFENTKHIYFLVYNYKTQKYLLRIIFTLLHCYLLYLHYYILFYLYLHLVLDNHSMELGTRDKGVVYLHLVLDNHSMELGHKTTKLFCRLLEER